MGVRGRREKGGGRRMLAIDQIAAVCDTHGRNVFTLTALPGWRTDAVIPKP